MSVVPFLWASGRSKFSITNSSQRDTSWLVELEFTG